MVNRKNVHSRGKIPLSKYFQEFNSGDSVAVVKEVAVNSNFPKRLRGRTGRVEKKRGRIYIVKIKDQKKEKEFLIEPIHLRKIQN